MSFLEFVEGPMYYAAAAIFVTAGLWRIIGILRFGKKPDLAPPRGSATVGRRKGNLRHFFPRGLFAERTWMDILGGFGFHLGFFVLLFFAAPHIAFVERFTGLSWPALPRWGFIIAAEIAFAGLIVLWARRFSDPAMRQISDWDNHIDTWLTFLTMLTGCLAMQESVVALRATHMLFVNIWLIYFPFSRLMHAFTEFLSRGAAGASYGRKGMNP